MRINRFMDKFLKAITYIATILTIGTFLVLIIYIFAKGIPHLTPSLFSFKYTSENVSLIPAIITTLQITVLALLISLPLGILGGIYLVEYTAKNNKIVGIIRLTTETLGGIPSIVYGLFGLLFFVTFLGFGFSLISGALTLAIMVLPIVIRTTEEALKSVPDTFREASFGLGAGRLRTVFKVVLPSSMPGILGGVILSVGRIVGETAALIYTAGTMAQIPTSLFDSGRTLSVHMYALSSEGLHTDKAYATAVVLIILVLIINTGANAMATRIKGDRI